LNRPKFSHTRASKYVSLCSGGPGTKQSPRSWGEEMRRQWGLGFGKSRPRSPGHPPSSTSAPLLSLLFFGSTVGFGCPRRDGQWKGPNVVPPPTNEEAAENDQVEKGRKRGGNPESRPLGRVTGGPTRRAGPKRAKGLYIFVTCFSRRQDTTTTTASEPPLATSARYINQHTSTTITTAPKPTDLSRGLFSKGMRAGVSNESRHWG